MFFLPRALGPSLSGAYILCFGQELYHLHLKVYGSKVLREDEQTMLSNLLELKMQDSRDLQKKGPELRC